MAKRPPIAGLRRLLLVLLLGGAIAVVVVYALGRRRASPPAPETGAGAPSGDITLIGQGFEYTQTEKGRKLFRIRGDSVRLRGGNQVLLDGVALTLYDEKGTAYDVVARQATYDQEVHDAKLEGAVRLSGPDGMELATEALNLHDGGRIADSAGAVAFRYAGAYGGRADRLRFHVPRNFVLLAGKVRIESLPGAEEPLSLEAGTVLLERDRHQVRADKDVELRRGSDVVRAERLNALLSDDDRRLEFVRARRRVSGVLRSVAAETAGEADGTRRPGGDRADGVDEPDAGDDVSPTTETSFRCEVLAAFMAEDGRSAKTVELEGSDEEPVTVTARKQDGTVDTLTAGYALSSFVDGELRRVEALGGERVRLVETEGAGAAPAAAPPAADVENRKKKKGRKERPLPPPIPVPQPEPLREVVAEGLTASFVAGGGLAAVDADGDVVYRGADVRATGDRLRYDATTGKGEMTAAEGGAVRAVAERGELVAPRASWEDGPGVLTATGGVRSTLADAGGLEGSPLAVGGGSEGPVRVESREALWRRTPQAFLFRDKVRAWQGKNLLLADTLRGDRPEGSGGDVLTATGHVKTVWVSEPATSGGEAAAVPPEPVEVNADEMRYEKGAGVLTYRGSVRVEQGGKGLACRDLAVDLDETGKARTMTCTGAVRLTDRATGDSATGEHAVYDLAARTVDITGAPVKLTKGDGGRIEGTRLVYDLDRGRAQVMSQPPTSAPPPGAGKP